VWLRVGGEYKAVGGERNSRVPKTTARRGLMNDSTNVMLMRLFTGCYIVKV
jgi:hypothetical protein